MSRRYRQEPAGQGPERLRGRLIRRGLAPASVLLVLDGHLRSARAVVPPTLIESTIRPAAQFAAGGTAAAEAIPEAVVRHAEGVLFTMIGARYSQITIVISAIFLVALTGGLFASRQQSGEEPSGGIAAVSGKAGTAPVTDGQVKPTPLARECIGTWVLVGTPEKIGQLPPTVNVLKFFTGRHWAVTQTDPKTGDVVEHHGGTYKLDGDQYTETVDYATANMADHIKKSHKFKIKVEGDTYTQIGIDNPWSQVWKLRRSNDTPRSSPPRFDRVLYANGVAQQSPGSPQAHRERRVATEFRFPSPPAHPNGVSPARRSGSPGEEVPDPGCRRGDPGLCS